MGSRFMPTPENRESGDAVAANAKNGPQILVADPSATIVREGARLAVGHGLDREGEVGLREAMRNPEPSSVLRLIVARQEEATVVFADAGAGGRRILEAWRGGTSSFEVLLVDNDLNQPPVATDHFRDALAHVPPKRRTLDPKAAADHLLFGAVPGAHTFVAAIGRLGHGEHYRWQNGRTERNIFDPLIARPRPDLSPLDGIDAGLMRAIGRLPVAHDCVTQLSGGIDSALLHTYLPAGTPTVSGAIDSPEFARECAYAEQASRLLGSKHRIFMAPESDFLNLVVDAIRLSGLPTRFPQPAYYNLTFKFPASRFVNGEFGDMLFGLKPTVFHIDAFRQRCWLHLADKLGLAHVLPQAKATGLQRRLERLRRIETPIGDWQGWGPRYGIYANAVLAERVIGAATMQQRIEARATYVAERFRSEERDDNPLFAHLEFGHMLIFYCSDAMSHWRQLAQIQGKSLLAPYASRSVVEAALAVPRNRRYIDRGRIKYLAKDLLKRRLPSFDVDAPKAGGDLPIQRYFGSNPREGTHVLVDRETAAIWRAAAASSKVVASGPLEM
jgi:asparagine synthetase B (glutamine-hydrolysing)